MADETQEPQKVAAFVPADDKPVSEVAVFSKNEDAPMPDDAPKGEDNGPRDARVESEDDLPNKPLIDGVEGDVAFDATTHEPADMDKTRPTETSPMYAEQTPNASAPPLGNGIPGNAEPPPGKNQVPGNAVKVDGKTRRSDDDALEGVFAEIVNGDHKGTFGVFDRVLEYGDDGYPSKVLFSARTAQAELLTVDYADLRPATAGRR